MDQKKKVDNYLLVAKIGYGKLGVIYKGVLVEDQRKVFAIKCIEKKKLEYNSVLNRLFQTEMSLMSKLNHPNIMHLFEVMETAHNYYLVIQFCNNGDLETYLKKMGRLSEEEAVYFLMQIMNGFQVLHKNKIMHKNFKLANIFLQDDKVVIGDFGFVNQGVDVTCAKLGTPITMPPELLSGNESSHTSKADLWSIGVFFYQMLFGKTPFDAKYYCQLKEKVFNQSGKNLNFSKDVAISPECKDLLINLLQYNATQRIDWKDFFNHALFELHS
jgi:serine/threonine protein kinase